VELREWQRMCERVSGWQRRKMSDSEGSEGVRYFGNKFGDVRTVQCLV
jgi:hypothetical protein